MLDPVRASILVPAAPERAFAFFVEEVDSWWPPEYTWSGEVLDHIEIEPAVGGRCYERGPHGFQCDWGRVLRYEPPSVLALRWQISPDREPVPDPRRASEVTLTFAPAEDRTRVEVVHEHFERHGPGAAAYRAALASEQGWPFLLRHFHGHLSH